MGARRHFLKPKDSTKLSYDGGHIQKIKHKPQSAPRPSVNNVYKLSYFHKPLKVNWGDFSHNRGRDRGDIFNDHNDYNDSFRLERFLKNRQWRVDDYPRLYSPQATRDYSSVFHTNFQKPVFKVSKPDVSNLTPKHTPVSTIWLAVTSVIFCVLCVIRLIVYAQRGPSEERSVRRRLSEQRHVSSISPTNPQEHDSDNGSHRLLVRSEISPQRDSHSDLPPPYFECAASNNGIINKRIDITSEEPPPPYSTCLETLSNADEIPKIHKQLSVEDPQSHTDTDIHLNDIDTIHINSSEQNGSNDGTLSR